MVANGVVVVSEGARGCGYRKKGGKYLISEGVSVPCPALPQEVARCPCCDAGIKPTRSWAWFNPSLFFKFPCPPTCGQYQEEGRCGPFKAERAGILWIGEKFYPTPEDWLREAKTMGVSRRIPQIPKDLKIGETWVFVGHRKAIEKGCDVCDGDGEDLEQLADERGKHVCKKCDGTGAVKVPGVFHAFQPTRIEVIVDEDISQKEADKLIKKGLTPVVVHRLDEDGNEVNEDGGLFDEWRTIRCANPECGKTHVMDIESVHDRVLEIAFGSERERDEYVMGSIKWHTTDDGIFCRVECMPEKLRQQQLFDTREEE